MDFAITFRAAEDKSGLKGIVVKSSVVPQQSCKVTGNNRINKVLFGIMIFLHFAATKIIKHHVKKAFMSSIRAHAKIPRIRTLHNFHNFLLCCT